MYKSTELHLVQDESEDFQETWSFMDRRLADVAFFGSFRKNVRFYGAVNFLCLISYRATPRFCVEDLPNSLDFAFVY